MENTQCYIESLPLELLLPILTYLPDLESLDSLLIASPAAYRAFETRSLHVFKKVLSSGNTHTYSCALIRIIAFIRAGSLPPTVYDLETFRTLVIHETTVHRWNPSIWAHPISSWPSDLPISIIRSLLITNRKVQRLTIGCLEYYLTRFRPLRPFQSPEFTLHSGPYAAYFEGDAYVLGAWKDKPANTIFYYPIQDVGPPSWQEQQRVIRAFWRIELSNALKTAVGASLITLPVEEDYYRGAETMSPTDLCDAGAVGSTSKMLRHREWHHSETTLEEELLNSVTEYTQDAEIISEPTYWCLNHARAAKSMPMNEQEWVSLDETLRSATWTCFSGLTGREGWHEDSSLALSPLQHVNFSPWRRFGFAIWDRARMVRYGLVSPHTNTLLVKFIPYFEAWRSLMTQDERDAVEAEIRRWEGLS